MEAVQNELETTYHYTPEQIANGGLRITTTLSKPMMNSLYASVKQQESLIKGGMPNWAHAGAVLEQPSTGEIWAIYGGPNYEAPAKKCARIRCQWDMALQNREQVGSSFKPYVLALARSQGMSVKTSTLDGHTPLWIPPVAEPMTYASQTQPVNAAGYYEVGNDAGDAQANGVSVVTASAESLNTAYTDLYHRVAGTDGQNMVQMAQAFGVDTSASGLATMRSEVGTALGQASLTVEEQASTFATLANNGQYIAPHVILQIQQQLPNAPMTTTSAKVTRRMVLTPAEDSDVDYALSFDTSRVARPHRGAGRRPGRHRQDRHHQPVPVGVLHRRDPAVQPGGGHVHQRAGLPGQHRRLRRRGQPGECAAGRRADPVRRWLTCRATAASDRPRSGTRTPRKIFGTMPVQNFPTPDFGGTAWNLLGPYTPKPKANHTPTRPDQHLPRLLLRGHCHHDRAAAGGIPPRPRRCPAPR